MSQSPEALSPVAPSQVEYVRSRPELYFRGPLDAAWLIGLIVSGAIAHGASDVRAEQHDGWWTITSSRDWLERDAMDAFFTLKPAPATGPNTHRMEILLVAFTEDVWTATPGDPVAISRVGPLPEPVRAWLESSPSGRVIAFKFTEPTESPPSRHLALVPFDEALRELPQKMDEYP